MAPYDFADYLRRQQLKKNLLGRLPLELLVEVFTHFPFSEDQMRNLKLVNRQWCQLVRGNEASISKAIAQRQYDDVRDAFPPGYWSECERSCFPRNGHQFPVLRMTFAATARPGFEWLQGLQERQNIVRTLVLYNWGHVAQGLEQYGAGTGQDMGLREIYWRLGEDSKWIQEVRLGDSQLAKPQFEVLLRLGTLLLFRLGDQADLETKKAFVRRLPLPQLALMWLSLLSGRRMVQSIRASVETDLIHRIREFPRWDLTERDWTLERRSEIRDGVSDRILHGGPNEHYKSFHPDQQDGPVMWWPRNGEWEPFQNGDFQTVPPNPEGLPRRLNLALLDAFDRRAECQRPQSVMRFWGVIYEMSQAQMSRADVRRMLAETVEDYEEEDARLGRAPFQPWQPPGPPLDPMQAEVDDAIAALALADAQVEAMPETTADEGEGQPEDGQQETPPEDAAQHGDPQEEAAVPFE